MASLEFNGDHSTSVFAIMIRVDHHDTHNQNHHMSMIIVNRDHDEPHGPHVADITRQVNMIIVRRQRRQASPARRRDLQCSSLANSVAKASAARQVLSRRRRREPGSPLAGRPAKLQCLNAFLSSFLLLLS